jgi:uncharacterized membrane protein YdjX (TVP38/TMEM64 family)
MDRRVLAGVALVAVVAATLLVSPTAVLESVAALAADPLLFAVAMAGVYLVRPLFAWPTVLCSVAVGYGFGVAGLPLALAGVVVTSLPPFLATRWVLGSDGGLEADGTPGRRGVVAFLSAPASRARRVGERFFAETGDVRGVTAAKLSPIPADAATCGAAASGVSLRGFVAGTLLGELPWTVAAVLVGASAGRVVTDGLGSQGPVVGIAAGVCALALVAGPTYRLLVGDSSPTGDR